MGGVEVLGPTDGFEDLSLTNKAPQTTLHRSDVHAPPRANLMARGRPANLLQVEQHLLVCDLGSSLAGGFWGWRPRDMELA